VQVSNWPKTAAVKVGDMCGELGRYWTSRKTCRW